LLNEKREMKADQSKPSEKGKNPGEMLEEVLPLLPTILAGPKKCGGG